MEESLERKVDLQSEDDRTDVQKAGAKEEKAPDLSAYIEQALGVEKADIRTYSPLALAYIGDAVYDLWIRTYLVADGRNDPDRLHKKATRYVSAVAQSAIIKAMSDDLSEEEQRTVKRGRNAKPHSTAKNASVADYLNATGFECLIGYLYLKGETDRISMLIKKGIELTDNTENTDEK